MCTCPYDAIAVYYYACYGVTVRPLAKRARVSAAKYKELVCTHDDIQNMSRSLGHSSIRTTMDIYGHVIAGSGRKASKRFEEALKRASA